MKKNTTYSFDDGDVLVASSEFNTVIWARINGQWFNTALGLSRGSSDEHVSRNIDDKENGCTWNFVGNLFNKTPWADADHFTTSFYNE